MKTLLRTQSPFKSIFDDLFETDLIFKDDFYYHQPLTNIIEEDDIFKLEMSIPGFDKKEINMEIKNNKLKVSGKKEKEDISKKHKEFEVKSFSREFSLSDNINKNNIDAEYKNGILTVKMFKKDEEKYKINIKLK
jgi:HSP20 family protein